MIHGYLVSFLHSNAVLCPVAFASVDFRWSLVGFFRMELMSFYTAHSPSSAYLLLPWLLAVQNASGSFWIFAAQAPEPTASPQSQLPHWLFCFAFSTSRLRELQFLYAFIFLTWPVKESSTSRILWSFDWNFRSVGWIVESWFLKSINSVYPWTWYIFPLT